MVTYKSATGEIPILSPFAKKKERGSTVEHTVTHAVNVLRTTQGSKLGYLTGQVIPAVFFGHLKCRLKLRLL
jgi:hypothetical protein